MVCSVPLLLWLNLSFISSLIFFFTRCINGYLFCWIMQGNTFDFHLTVTLLLEREEVSTLPMTNLVLCFGLVMDTLRTLFILVKLK